MDRIFTFMKENKKTSWFIGIIGTIIVGGLGSGVWEYILKPLFLLCTNFILDITTLGIESYKNDIYETIAKGFTETSSIENNYLIGTIIIVFYVILLAFLSVKMQNLKQSLSLESSEPLIPQTGNKEKKLNKIKSLFNVHFIMLVIVSISITTGSFKSRYINDSITYYEQLKKISLPYIDEHKMKLLDSNFALIKNKNDYILVISELEDILKKQNLELDRINIW